MPFRSPRSGATLALLFGIALLTGCKKKPPTEADPPPAAQPAAPDPNAPAPDKKPKADAPAAEAELSDVQVTVLGPKAARVSAKYRFTTGGPSAADAYMFTLDYTFGEGEVKGSGAAILKTGAEFRAEGVFQGEFATFKPIPPGTTFAYTAKVQKQRGKSGPYRDVSNVVKGSVTYQP